MAEERPDVPVVLVGEDFVAWVDHGDAEKALSEEWLWEPYRGGVVRARRPRISLARFLLGLDGRDGVTFVDDDLLNNRRENLRPHTATNQARGQRKTRAIKGKPVTSRYRGVNYDSSKGGYKKWHARIYISGQRTHLGWFLTEEEAARAWDDAAREHYGKDARLNFPLSGEKSALE